MVFSFEFDDLKSKKHDICKLLCTLFVNIFYKLLFRTIIYPCVMFISILLILPSCYLLLIVRMAKVETTTKAMAHRERVISAEPKCKRCIRLLKQLIRGIFMFAFLFILPLFITLVLVPFYKDTSYGYWVELGSIGGYLLLILLLQVFGTYRAMVSFFQRTNEAKEAKEKEKMAKLKVGLFHISQQNLQSIHGPNIDDGGGNNDDDANDKYSRLASGHELTVGSVISPSSRVSATNTNKSFGSAVCCYYLSLFCILLCFVD